MYTSNLSSLLSSDFFLKSLKNEDITYDRIISDQPFSVHFENLLLLQSPFTELATEKKIKKSDTILLILNQLNSLPLLTQLKDYQNLTILNANTGLASFGNKIQAEIDYLPALHQTGFELFFPFDQNQFFKILQKPEGKKHLSLTNQEIPENIYQLPDDEEITFIDKALAEQPENIALINNPDAPTHILAFGSYFEQLVQLSQLLLQRNEAFHLTTIAKLSLLSSDHFQNQLKKANKLIIIADHLASKEFLTFLASLLDFDQKNIQLLSPNYQKLTTTLADYQLEQSDFDALALHSRM